MGFSYSLLPNSRNAYVFPTCLAPGNISGFRIGSSFYFFSCSTIYIYVRPIYLYQNIS